jgi:hypothetical protein
MARYREGDKVEGALYKVRAGYDRLLWFPYRRHKEEGGGGLSRDKGTVEAEEGRLKNLLR